MFMRFPQFPSSRAFGDAPAVTPWEVHARVPADPSARKIIPVPQRPFPDALRQQDLVTPPREPSDYAALAWGVTLAIGVGALLYALASQWR